MKIKTRFRYLDVEEFEFVLEVGWGSDWEEDLNLKIHCESEFGRMRRGLSLALALDSTVVVVVDVGEETLVLLLFRHRRRRDGGIVVDKTFLLCRHYRCGLLLLCHCFCNRLFPLGIRIEIGVNGSEETESKKLKTKKQLKHTHTLLLQQQLPRSGSIGNQFIEGVDELTGMSLTDSVYLARLGLT